MTGLKPGEVPETDAEPGPHESDRVVPEPPVAPEMQPDTPPEADTEEPAKGEP